VGAPRDEAGPWADAEPKVGQGIAANGTSIGRRRTPLYVAGAGAVAAVLLVVGIAIVAGQGGGETSPPPPPPPTTVASGELAVDTVQEGDLLAGDVHQFEVTGGGETVDIYVEADIDTKLDLYDANGEWVAGDDDSDGHNPLLTSVVAGAGYTVEILAYDSEDEGHYLIGAQTVAVDTGGGTDTTPTTAQGPPELLFDTALEGDLLAGETDQFEVIGTGEDVELYVDGELDTALALYDDGGNLLVSDEDSGGEDNPLLSQVLDAGARYLVEVSDFDSSAAGHYVITARDAGSADNAMFNVLSYDRTASRFLEPFEVHRYRTTGDGTTWQFSVESDVETVIRVQEEETLTLVAESDASLNPVATVELADGQTYLMDVYVYPFDSGVSGTYTFSAA
jgi:hypothetical protein